MYAYELDENGYIIENYLVGGDVPVPENSITVQLPQPLPFFKPKWNGEEWVEGATQEEIDESTKPQLTPPSLEQRIAELENTILNLLEVL